MHHFKEKKPQNFDTQNFPIILQSTMDKLQSVYLVVQFHMNSDNDMSDDDEDVEMEVVPRKWVTECCSTPAGKDINVIDMEYVCKWPQKATDASKLYKMVVGESDPAGDWEEYNVTVLYQSGE